MGKRIRPVTPLDLLPLIIPPAATLRLDLAQQLVSPHQLLRGLLASWLNLREPSHTLLCWSDGRLLGCAQAWPLPENLSWEVQYLAVWKAGVTSADALWEELLAGLGVEAGRQGMVRLLARLPSEEHLELFRRAGFLPFAEEMILAWDATAEPGVQPMPGLQPVQTENLWAIHQLYTNLTPPVVQQAEGYTSDSWQPRRGEEGWVWQEQGGARAYVRRRRGSKGTCVDLLLDPAVRQHAPALLAGGLAGVSPPVYLVLRSFQGELLEVANRLGFRAYAEQVLLAKFLAVSQEQRQPVSAHKADRYFEAAPTTPSVGNV